MSSELDVSGKLQALRQVLEGAGSTLLSREHLRSCLERLERLEERLEACSGPLHVGLMGGTGVGKSTLINALAEAEISSASDRRPHTDRIVVYRHREREIEELSSDLVIQPHRVHDHELIRNLVIYDLPDFDSVLPGNRARVLAFLERLDVVCWVASPEKYGDRAFYEMIRLSPQDPANFVFVLNKIDEFVDRDGRYDPAVLERVLQDFRNKLISNGVRDPRIYPVSALHPRESAFADRFEPFRRWIYRKWEEKEIRAVKRANIEQEVQELLQDLAGELDVQRIREVLSSLLDEVDSAFEEIRALGTRIAQGGPVEAGRHALRALWLSRERGGGLVVTLLKVGLALPRLISLGRPSTPDLLFTPDERLIEAMVRRIETIQNRVRNALAALPIPEQSWEPLREVDSLPPALEGMGAEWTAKVREWFASDSCPPVQSRMLRLLGRLCLSLPPLLFFLYLMGPDRMIRFVEHPGFSQALDMLSSAVFSFFQPKGLVALLGLLFLEFLVACFLARRALRSLDKKVDRFMDRLGKEYRQALIALVDEYHRDLEGKLVRVQEGARRIEALGVPSGKR